MKHRCSRCCKVRPVAFEYEVATKTHGVRELILCEHCMKWGLLRVLSSPDGLKLFDLLYTNALEVAEYITAKSKENKTDKIITPNPNAIV